MDPRTDKLIGRAALFVSVALVLLVAGTATGVIVPPTMGWVRAKMGWPPPPPATAYTVGEASDAPPAWYADSPYTLIVFARSTCSACERSKPLHQQLIRDAAMRTGLRVMLATPGERSRELAYGRGLGLADERIVGIDASKMKVKMVPTLLLVDRNGIVIDTKEGVLPEAEQHAFMETIAKLK